MRTRRCLQTVACTLALLVVGCSDDEPVGPPGVGSVTLVADTSVLELGDSTRIMATVLDATGAPMTGQQVTWSSSDPSVLVVAGNGMAVGRGGGTAIVEASAGGQSGSVAITVHPWNVAEHVVVVDSAALRLVSDSTERVSGTLRFEVLAGNPPAVEVGAIVVGVQAGGFLRRVTSVSTVGGQLTLETDAAALSEVIEFGGFATSIDLLFEPGLAPEAFAAATRTLRPGEVIWSEGTFTYLAPGLVPQRAGFDLSGLDVCQVLKESKAGECPAGVKKLEVKSGKLGFEPDLELEAAFDGFELESFRGVAKGDLSLDVALALEAEVKLPSFEAKPRMFTFTKSFATTIGPVPIIGYVEMNVDGNLSVKATAKGAVEAGFKSTGSIELGAEWEDEWEPVSESSGDFEPQAPSIADGTLAASIEVEASVGLKPRLMVIFYGVVGPFAEVEPFGKATLTFGTQACNLKTESGINAAIGFTIPFLDDDVADYDHDWSPVIEGPSSDWDCPLGTLDVGVETSGENADDAYTVAVDGVTKATLSGSGRTTIEFVQTGERTVTLEDVAPNCSVAGDASRKVDVTPGGTQAVDFAVTCSALTGAIEVRTSTEGAAPDPDGYTVTLGATSQPIGTNASVVFENVLTGLQTVTLSDVASNCEVTGGSVVDVQVQSGSTATVQFTVECSAAELTVRVPVEGPPAKTSGWAVLLDGGESRSIAPNGQTTFSTTPGAHTVTLTGLPPNCQVDGEHPRTVDVVGGAPTEVELGVTCEGAGLTVTVSTEGDPDPATGYQATAGGKVVSIGVNGSASFSDLPVGSVSVGLQGVPEHCTVQGLNPRTTSVPGSVTFQVVCQAPAQCTEPPANGHAIYTTQGVFPDDTEYPWSTNAADITSLEYGWVAGRSTAASSDEDRASKSSVIDVEWHDHLFFVPIDAERAGESVTLRFRHVGHVEITRSGEGKALAQASIRGHSAVIRGDRGDDWTTPQRTDFDEIVSLDIELGAWTLVWGILQIDAVAEAESSITADGEQRFTLLDVRDSGGQIVPVAQICTVSGTDYTASGT